MTISEYALKFVGHPYIWGGDGTGKKDGGFDCSGLVVECLQAFGLLPQGDWTAQGIADTLLKNGWKRVPAGLICGGDVIAWGKGEKAVTHISIALNGWQHVEAGGGGSSCTTEKTSTGFVRVRPLAWRSDLAIALRRY